MYAKGKKRGKRKERRKWGRKGREKRVFFPFFFFPFPLPFFSLSLSLRLPTRSQCSIHRVFFFSARIRTTFFYFFIPHAPLAVSYHQSPFRVPSLFSFGSIEMEEKGREKKKVEPERRGFLLSPLVLFSFLLLSLHLWSFFSPSEKGVGIRTLEM